MQFFSLLRDIKWSKTIRYWWCAYLFFFWMRILINLYNYMSSYMASSWSDLLNFIIIWIDFFEYKFLFLFFSLLLFVYVIFLFVVCMSYCYAAVDDYDSVFLYEKTSLLLLYNITAFNTIYMDRLSLWHSYVYRIKKR